jgi:hypothetical protein
MSAYRHAETGQGPEQELSSVSESHEESDTMHLIASRNSNSTADTAVHFSGNSDSTNDTEQPFDEEHWLRNTPMSSLVCLCGLGAVEGSEMAMLATSFRG